MLMVDLVFEFLRHFRGFSAKLGADLLAQHATVMVVFIKATVI